MSLAERESALKETSKTRALAVVWGLPQSVTCPSIILRQQLLCPNTRHHCESDGETEAPRPPTIWPGSHTAGSQLCLVALPSPTLEPWLLAC